MPSFKALRDTLAEELSLVLPIPVHASWPKTFTVPCVWFAPPISDAYVNRGPAFGQYTLSIDVVILVPHNEPAESLDLLESYLQTVLINSADWECGGVEPPSPYTVAEEGADYLGVIVHLSKPTVL